jgi:hypothetical protein
MPCSFDLREVRLLHKGKSTATLKLSWGIPLKIGDNVKLTQEGLSYVYNKYPNFKQGRFYDSGNGRIKNIDSDNADSVVELYKRGGGFSLVNIPLVDNYITKEI